MLTRRQNAWIPTPEEMGKAQNQIGRMMIQRFPWAIDPIRADDMREAAFAEGYIVYARKFEANPREIGDAYAFVIESGYRRGCKLLTKWARQNDKERLFAPTVHRDNGKNTSPSMESALSSQLGEIEKSNPASKAIRKERGAAIMEAIQALSPKQRKAVLDVHIAGMKMQAAANDQGVSLRVFERCLDTATAKLAWRVSLTSSDAMCSTYRDIVLTLKTPMEPSKNERKHLCQHVASCQECRHAVYDSPMVIDVGLLLATGAFTASAGASFGDRLSSSPVVEVLLDAARGLGHRVTPGGGGGGHAAEAGAGATGAGAVGAGGTVLVFGGGKALVALCAGAATTACVLGAATGIIPITQAKNDKDGDQDQVAIERLASPSSLAPLGTGQAAGSQQIKTESRRAAVRKREAEKKAAAAKAEAAENSQPTYTAPTTAPEPTTQSATNQSSAVQSMGIPTAPAPAAEPPPEPSAQTQTNQSSADASLGCC